MSSICVKLSPENKLILDCACLAYGTTQTDIVNQLVSELQNNSVVKATVDSVKKVREKNGNQG